MKALIVNESVKDFGELFTKGIEYLAKACQVYVKAIDANPDNRAAFEEAYPEISASAWKRFEAVGRGSLHVKLLTNFTPVAKRLERFAYSEQERYVNGPVEVLLHNGDTLKVDIHNLQPDQVRQVFAVDHVRNIAQQRAYIESLKSGDEITRVRKAKVRPYVIVKHKLVIGDVSFSKADLLRILVEMEK